MELADWNKSKGGELCTYASRRGETVDSEFTIIMVMAVAPDANAKIALDELHRAVTSQQSFHPDAVHS